MDSSNVKCSICSDEVTIGLYCNIGHYICKDCMFSCPLCNLNDSTLNDLKSLTLKNRKEETDHNNEEHIACEGAKFANWKCKWKGNTNEILDHFKSCHKENILIYLQPFLQTKIDLSRPSCTIKLISLSVNQEEKWFWYKQKIDVEKELTYWLLQYIGDQDEASKYFYEFTVVKHLLDVLKIRDICKDSTCNVKDVIAEGKCIVIPFNVIKRYLRDKEVTFIFKIELLRDNAEDIKYLEEKLYPSTDISCVRNCGLNINYIRFYEEADSRPKFVNLQVIINMTFYFTRSHVSDYRFFCKRKKNEEAFLFKCDNDLKRKSTCFLVQYLENKTKASNFFYEIIIPFDFLKTFRIRRYCQSCYEEESTLDSEESCVRIPFSIIMSCLNEQNEITFVLKIYEQDNLQNSSDIDTYLSSHVNIMPESLEMQFTKPLYRYMFTPGSELGLSKEFLEQNPKNVSELVITPALLSSAVFLDFQNHSVHTMDCVDVTIFIKTLINFDKSCSHYKMVSCSKNQREEVFWVKLYFNTKTKLMNWIVEYLGLTDRVHEYFYELSVYSEPSNFLKARKICESPSESAEKYISEGRCVSIPFNTVKNFMHENGEFHCSIRIKESDKLIEFDGL